MKGQRWSKRCGSLLAGVLAILGMFPIAAVAREDVVSSDSTGTLAIYDGRLIDMSKDWEGAGACLVWSEAIGTPECFDTEEQMDDRITELESLTTSVPESIGGGSAIMLAASCSGSLKLYDGTSYGGQVVSLWDRSEWLNLSIYGFDNKTSSFKIGPCSAYFAANADGGGSWYPIAGTEAYDVAPTMSSGWNNVVSSIYIN